MELEGYRLVFALEHTQLFFAFFVAHNERVLAELVVEEGPEANPEYAGKFNERAKGRIDVVFFYRLNEIGIQAASGGNFIPSKAPVFPRF